MSISSRASLAMQFLLLGLSVLDHVSAGAPQRPWEETVGHLSHTPKDYRVCTASWIPQDDGAHVVCRTRPDWNGYRFVTEPDYSCALADCQMYNLVAFPKSPLLFVEPGPDHISFHGCQRQGSEAILQKRVYANEYKYLSLNQKNGLLRIRVQGSTAPNEAKAKKGASYGTYTCSTNPRKGMHLNWQFAPACQGCGLASS